MDLPITKISKGMADYEYVDGRGMHLMTLNPVDSEWDSPPSIKTADFLMECANEVHRLGGLEEVKKIINA